MHVNYTNTVVNHVCVPLVAFQLDHQAIPFIHIKCRVSNSKTFFVPVEIEFRGEPEKNQLSLVPVEYTPVTGDVYRVMDGLSHIRAMETNYSYVICSHELTVIWKVVLGIPKCKN